MTISGPAVRISNPPPPQRRSTALSFSDTLAAAMAARSLYYGWVVAGATFLVMLATAGAMGAPGVIMQPLEKEFGWSAADISSALALRIALFGLMAPFSAAFINRFGVRPVVIAAVAMISGGVLASLAMTELWQLVALWGVIVGVGTGLVALVLGATVATRWFVERRGLVVGMLTASNATGQLIFLPLLAKLTQDYGWRVALGLVVAMLLVAGAVALLTLRDRPADLGLAAYGAKTIEPAPKQAASLGAMMASPIGAFYEARSSRTFWILMATFFVCGLSTNGLIQTHWVSLCGDYGVTPVAAAGALAVIGAFDFVGTILSGWLSDRYDNRWLLFVYYGLRGLVAAPASLHRIFGDRTFGLRGLLRPRLGGDRAADGAADRRTVRAGEGQSHLRLDLRLAHARGGGGGAGRGDLPHRVRDLPALALCRGRRLPDRGRSGVDDRGAAQDGARAGLSPRGRALAGD